MKPVDSGPCSWDLASQQLEILPLVRTKACTLGIFIGIQKPSPLHNRSHSQEKSAQRSNRIATMVFELITNVGIVAFFFLDLYFLMQRWRSKVRISVSISLPGAEEIMAVVALFASFSYVLGFFGIHFTVKSAADFDHRKPQKSPEPDWVPISNSVPNSKSRPAKEFVKEECQEDSDEELAAAVVAGDLASHSLESKLQDCSRAVSVRRRAVEIASGRDLEGLGFEGFDYGTILGQCCEMPIGFVRIPVGVAGPLLVDGSKYFVPMATTEGCLVASINRGCKVITLSGGASSVILDDGMTRAPVVKFQTAKRAAELKFYVEDPKNFEHLSSVFNSTSRFARLRSIKCALAGRNLYLRVKCSTGDAMGMNMVSKGAQLMLEFLNGVFPDMEVLSISGNFCADKKPTAINWIEGRGKSVSCEAVIKKEIVESVLKTSVNSLIELNMVKNLAGSAVAGAVGGNNAHAANIVSALFIATGQDPAQNLESSQCITMAESTCSGDLHFSVTMPCIEVGTVGGGTHLSSQAACLNLLGVRGANADVPGLNAQQLAKIVAGAVLAGELSLMAALSVGHLVKSHMKYNRSSKNISSINAAVQ